MGLIEEIKRMRQIMSVISEGKSGVSISCPKCDHGWTIEDDDEDPYLCHKCGYDKLERKYEPDKLAKWKKESGLKENDEDDSYGDRRDDLVSVKVRLKSMGVNDGSRIHITHSENLEPKQVNQENDRPKPRGLWYGVGFGWIDFTISDFTSFYDKDKNVSVFEFDVNSVNLLRITNFDELVAFDKEYCNSTERYRNPDWTRL
jgi:ribosomal protein S27AE